MSGMIITTQHPFYDLLSLYFNLDLEVFPVGNYSKGELSSREINTLRSECLSELEQLGLKPTLVAELRRRYNKIK